MKRIFKSLVIITTIAAVSSITSCTKTCDPGYEGTDCKTEMRTKFTGATSTSYTAAEDGSLSAPATYTLTISKSSTDVQKILIGNLWNAFSAVAMASVDGTGFTIASQEPDNDDFVVQGSGTISGNVITVTYNVTDNTVSPATTDVVTGTWTKL